MVPLPHAIVPSLCKCTVLVVMMRSKEFKTSRSMLMLILCFSLCAPLRYTTCSIAHTRFVHYKIFLICSRCSIAPPASKTAVDVEKMPTRIFTHSFLTHLQFHTLTHSFTHSFSPTLSHTLAVSLPVARCMFDGVACCRGRVAHDTPVLQRRRC